VLIKLSLEKYESTELDTNTQKDLIAFMLERMRIYELSNGVPSDVYDTVQSKVLFKPLDIRKRLQAAIEFSKLESAKSLVAANKRIANILKKAPSVKDIQLDKTLLLDEAELTLATKISDLSPDLNKLYLDGKYVAYLTSLEELSGPIELFFKDVMVMSDDEAIRNNRLQLLKTVHKLFVQVVDIGHLKI
jgi:glycyl-tRNA synthetase beta chain